MKATCDICGDDTRCLIDYFCMICYDCRDIHTDITLLRRIGNLASELERVKHLQEFGYSVEEIKPKGEVDVFFEQMRGASA